MVYLFDWTNRQQTKYGQDPKQNSKDRDRQRAKLRFAYKNGTIHNFNQLDNISILLPTIIIAIFIKPRYLYGSVFPSRC